MILAGFAEPENECCEVESGPVAGREFVEAGRDGPELFEPIEAAFDDVADLVEVTIEGRRSAAGPAAPHPVGPLISPFRDHRPDAPAPQRLADRP